MKGNYTKGIRLGHLAPFSHSQVRILLHQLTFCPFSPSVEAEAALVADAVGLFAER